MGKSAAGLRRRLFGAPARVVFADIAPGFPLPTGESLPATISDRLLRASDGVVTGLMIFTWLLNSTSKTAPRENVFNRLNHVNSSNPNASIGSAPWVGSAKPGPRARGNSRCPRYFAPETLPAQPQHEIH